MTAPGGATVFGRAIIRILPDVRNFARTLRRQLHTASSQLKSLQRDLRPVQRQLQFLARNATGIAPGIRLATAALTALGAEAIAGGVLAVAGAVYELAGSLLIVPAVAVAGASAMATLKVGLHGVQDAIKNFDKPGKFAEKVELLSKNAQAFMGVLDRLRPRINAFRNAVQDQLFAGLDKTLAPLANRVLPLIQRHFVTLAKEFNGAAKDVVGFVQRASTMKDLTGITKNIEKGFHALRPAILPVSQAILDLVATGSELLPEIGRSVSDLATKFAGFISQARASGQLKAWMQGGLNILMQLGRIIGNVVVALHALLSTAKAAGLGLVDTLETASEKLRAFFTSAQGQNAVAKFLLNAKDAALALLPIVGALAVAFFGHLIPALTEIAMVLAPSVEKFVYGLGEAIDIARPGVEAFAFGFGKLIEAMIPALPAVAALISALGRLVGALAAGLGPAISDIIVALSGLLVPVINTVADLVSLLPAGFFKFIAVLGVVVFAILGVIKIMRAFIAFASLFAAAMGVAATASLVLTRAVVAFSAFMRGPWGIAIIAAVALLGSFALGSSGAAEKQASLKAAAQDLNAAIREQNGVIDESIRRKAAQQLEDAGALDLANQLGISTTRLTNAYVNQGPALDNLINQLKSKLDGENLAVAAQNASTDAHAREVVANAQLLAILLQLKGGREADTAAQKRVNEASNETTASLDRQRDAYYGLIDAQRAKSDQDLAGINTTIDYQRQLAATRTELAEGTKTLDVNTKEGQDNLSAVTQLIDRGNARIAQLKAEKQPIQVINGELANQRRNLLDLLTPFFKDRDAARAFAIQLGLIPKKTVAQIVLEDKAARAAAFSYGRLLDYIARDRVATVRFNVTGNAQAAAGVPTGGFPRAAIGGKFNKGDFAVVGENGPELVAFGREARVFSNRDSLQMTDNSDRLARMTRKTKTGDYQRAVTPTPSTEPTTVTVTTQPQVRVFIGNREVKDVVVDVVNERDRQLMRVMKSGARSKA